MSTVLSPTSHDYLTGRSQDRPFAGWLVARRVALVAMALVLVTGMAFSFSWLPMHGHSGWATPGDLWATYRSAHFVGWGDLGGVYASGTGLVTFPGITVALAPVAMFTGALGLTESFPLTLPHPTAWLVLGPVELLLGSSLIIALDSLAEQLGVSSRRRLVLSLTEAVVVWPLVAIWGHPEDGLAMAFAVAAVTGLLRGNLRACGWLLGIALAFQPLTILMAPIFVAIMPSARQRAFFVVRSVLPAAVLVLPGLIQYWHATVDSLLRQPNYPSINHATPLLSFAPVLKRGRVTHSLVTQLHYSGGTYHLVRSWALIRQGEVVAAGPGRMVAMALACGIGVWAWRHRVSVTPTSALWLMAACLSLRCLLESVMDPFYFVPPLVMMVFCGSLGRGWHFFTVGLLAGAISVYSEYHFGPWIWYLPLVVLLVAGLVASAPKVRRAPTAESLSNDPAARRSNSRRLRTNPVLLDPAWGGGNPVSRP